MSPRSVVRTAVVLLLVGLGFGCGSRNPPPDVAPQPSPGPMSSVPVPDAETGGPDPSPGSTPSSSPAPDITVPTCLTPQPVRFRVLTLNIHAARTNAGRLELDRVAAELSAWRPDVVLLQEVDNGRTRSRLVAQAKVLGNRLGLAWVDGPNRTFRGGLTGNAILSRFPVLAADNHSLPGRRGLIPRGLLQATLEIAGREVEVYSAHLDHASSDARRAQAQAVARILGRSSRPVILGGDLNAVPGTPPVRSLTGAGLVDAWSAVGRGAGHTVPAYSPRRRIDYVLADATFVPVGARVLRSSVSDHRAVLARLSIQAIDCS